MAAKRVNPNRMELLRLKNQLRTARRGHKLMKDKRDELMRQFLAIVRDIEQLRLRMEELLSAANREMVLARASMGSEVVEACLLTETLPLELIVKQENTMSVRTPVFRTAGEPKEGDQTPKSDLPYGMASATGELDQAVDALKDAFPAMMELAEVEHKAHLMAAEIERTRRRVNSLEYVMIPDLEDTIHSITMKMDENERGNLTRLMKVKDIIIADQIEKKKLEADARRHAQA